MSEASPAPGASESAETQVSTESAAQTGTQDVTAASSTATQTDATRESSPGQAEKKPASMLDAIKAAGQKAAAASPAAEGGQTDAIKDATGADPSKDPKESDEDLPDDPTEEEQARWHSKTRKRFKMLMGQRDEARERLRDLEPAADVGSRMISYARDNGLSGEEVNSGLAIMAAMKADPVQAMAMLKPYYEALAALVGEGELPPDLKKAVEEGRTEEQFARETARTRAAAMAAENRRQHVEQRSTVEATQRVQAEATERIRGAIGAWERQWAASDPDYRVKSKRTLEKVQLGFYSGQIRITTPEEAVAFAEKCRKEVEEDLKQFAPRRTAVSPVTGVAAMTGAAPKPTSLLEAMKQAAGRM